MCFERTCPLKHASPHHVFGESRGQSVTVGVLKSKKINVVGQGEPKHLDCVTSTCSGGGWELGGSTWVEGTTPFSRSQFWDRQEMSSFLYGTAFVQLLQYTTVAAERVA